MTTADILGRFLWHDLMTTDQGAASAFYPKVVGWKSQPWEDNSSYQVWMTSNGASGGTSLLSPEAKNAGTSPHWLAYIGTPDIDATVDKAKELGGKVTRDVTDIPNVGKYAVLTDPQGATFAVYSPTSLDGTDSGAGVSWHELITSDPDAAWDFYSELFGWDKLASHDMGPMGMYEIFGQGSTQLGGIFKQPPDRPASPSWLPYISVPSAADAASAAKDAGGQIANGPMEVPGGDMIAQIIDPQGALFAVHQRKGAAAKPKKAKKSAAPKREEVSSEATPAVTADSEADSTPSTPKKARSKVAAKSKAPAKAAPAKTASSAKKGAAKKVPAKAPTRAAAKKSAPSKAAAKKAAAKKAPAKKAVAKKGKKSAAVKKSAAPKKKAAAKKKAATKVATKKKAARKK
jgi:predicted enzyme related to lactoylglutathione lyase